MKISLKPLFKNWGPLLFLIHERPAHFSIALKGSFWEQGNLAFFVGLLFITALALRIRHALWPRSKLYLCALYALALGCALATRSKSFWLALGSAFLVAGLLKPDAVC